MTRSLAYKTMPTARLMLRSDMREMPKPENSVTENSPQSPAPIDPDGALVSAMAEGDSQALAELMDRHLNSIKALAWHMLGDELSAEDVAQEVFLKSWLRAEKWEPGRAKYLTWMRRVATNLCLDKLRKKREILSDTLPDMVDSAQTADTAMIEDEVSDKVRAAITTLPDRQCAALTLCHYQNLSQAEAADILGISVSAYESLLARARRNLKKTLENDKQDLLSSLKP